MDDSDHIGSIIGFFGALVVIGAIVMFVMFAVSGTGGSFVSTGYNNSNYGYYGSNSVFSTSHYSTTHRIVTRYRSVTRAGNDEPTITSSRSRSSFSYSRPSSFSRSSFGSSSRSSFSSSRSSRY